MYRLLLREDFADDDQPVVRGRTLTIRVCTYGRVYEVSRAGRTINREKVAPGAFKEPLARPRGVLRFRHIGEHDGEPDALENFHGVLKGMVENDGSVYGDFEVFEGEREDRLLKLVESGGITGASMSGIVKADRKTRDAKGPITEILRISPFNGMSITPANAYDDAGVVAIREKPSAKDGEARADRIKAERKYWDGARSSLQELR